VGYSYAVVNGHPVFVVSFFLLFLLAHDFGEPSRRILDEPPEATIVCRRGVAEPEPAESSRRRSHLEYSMDSPRLKDHANQPECQNGSLRHGEP